MFSTGQGTVGPTQGYSQTAQEGCAVAQRKPSRMGRSVKAARIVLERCSSLPCGSTVYDGGGCVRRAPW
eukprot:7923295-Pyramimonas_sp.AAC.1